MIMMMMEAVHSSKTPTYQPTSPHKVTTLKTYINKHIQLNKKLKLCGGDKMSAYHLLVHLGILSSHSPDDKYYYCSV
jgi:hypothetical protein